MIIIKRIYKNKEIKMKKEDKILEEVEKTLNSFDNDIILQPNPYLLTRIKAKRAENLRKQKTRYEFKIGFRQILIFLLIIGNFLTLVYFYETSTKQNLLENLVIELRSDFQTDQQ